MASVLNNLGQRYQDTGDYERAELLLRRSLSIRERALGEEHPDVAQILRNLADHLVALHHYKQAEPLYQRALAILHKVFGPEHEDFVRTQEKYDHLLQMAGKGEGQ